MILIVILFCLIIFLYNLFLISKEDFILAKEDVTLNKIFNIAFLTILFSFFSSRFFFLFFNGNPKLFSLLGFFAITYLPGFSLTGTIVGGAIFTVFYCNLKKYPAGKVLDIFTRTFIAVLPLGFAFYFLISLARTSIIFNILFIVSIILSILFLKPLHRLSEKGEIKDGSYALIFITVFSFIYFLVKLFADIRNFSFFNPENIALFLSIFVSLVILINREIMEKYLERK